MTYQLPAALEVSVTGPPLEEVDGTVGVVDTIDIFLGGLPLPSGTIWSIESGLDSAGTKIGIPTPSIEATFALTYKDSSSSQMRPQAIASAPDGNEVMLTAKLQELQPDGTWQDLQGLRSWFTCVLQGPGGPDDAGSTGTSMTQVVGPGGDMQIYQTLAVTLPAQLTTTVRYAYSLWLGNTAGVGAWAEIATTGKSQGDLSYAPGDWIWNASPTATWQYTEPLELILVPLGFIQLTAVPIALIYAPPGQLDVETLTYQSSVATSWSMALSNTDALQVANVEINKTQDTVSASITPSFGLGPVTFQLGLPVSVSTEDTWQVGTIEANTITTGTSSTLITELTETMSFSVQDNNAKVGLEQPWDYQPFWSDTFVLVVNPQFAIWNYPGLSAMQLVAYLPGYYRVTVEELHEAVMALPFHAPPSTPCYAIVDDGANPPVNVELSLEECQQLLRLDPFYDALWQGTPLTGAPLNARFSHEQEFEWYGGQSNEISYTAAEVARKVSSYSQSYTAQIQSAFTAAETRSEGASTTVTYTPSTGEALLTDGLGTLPGGIGGAGNTSISQSTMTSDQVALTMTSTQQSTASAETADTNLAEITCGTSETFIGDQALTGYAYLDNLYGGIAVSDPNAPKPPDPEGMARLPGTPGLVYVYRYPIQWRTG